MEGLDFKNQNEEKVASILSENVGQTKWKIVASDVSKRSINYLAKAKQELGISINPRKNLISLASVDNPCIQPPQESVDAVIRVLQQGQHGDSMQFHSAGRHKAKSAIAHYLSYDGVYYAPEDIIICNGTTAALDICITVLADSTKNHNILLPKPVFPHYRTLMESNGISIKYYSLKPEQWEVNLDELNNQIDKNTAAILINNPSNPCGSVFSEDHLNDILTIAQIRKLPIIADEIYERITFKQKFVSVAKINSKVPSLICGGLSKRFLLPGWRLGWIAISDKTGALDFEIRQCLSNLSNRIYCENSLALGALPDILTNTKKEFFLGVIKVLEENAESVCDFFNTSCDALEAIPPKGSMHMLLKIDLRRFGGNILDDRDFCRKLSEEQSVQCLPGQCFLANGFIRISLLIDPGTLQEGCQRIKEFCEKHCLDI